MLALLLMNRTDDVSGVCDVLHCGGVSRGNSVTGKGVGSIPFRGPCVVENN